MSKQQCVLALILFVFGPVHASYGTYFNSTALDEIEKDKQEVLKDLSHHVEQMADATVREIRKVESQNYGEFVYEVDLIWPDKRCLTFVQTVIRHNYPMWVENREIANRSEVRTCFY